MFTTYQKSFGQLKGRTTQRHFQKWENARKELEKDRQDLEKNGYSVVRERKDFIPEKGIGLYEYTLKGNGELCTLALLDSFFED